MTRATLTTKQGKSKCLNYRDSHRCGRLGRYLVSGTQRGLPFKFPVCAECKDSLLAQGARLHGSSPKGYTVKESLFGPSTREYIKIL